MSWLGPDPLVKKAEITSDFIPTFFGFNARYNKNNQPQGQFVYVYRGTYNGVLPDYVIKSNSLTALSYSCNGCNYPISGTLQ